MENNFFVGIVHHNRKFFDGKIFFRDAYDEKMVLFKIEDNIYLDLINGICYSTDINAKDYVLKDSLVNTDIDNHKIDYKYLLSKYKDNALIKKRKNV